MYFSRIYGCICSFVFWWFWEKICWGLLWIRGKTVSLSRFSKNGEIAQLVRAHDS